MHWVTGRNTPQTGLHSRSSKLAVNMFHSDARRCRPTIAHVMCCQVARSSDRWYWYFTLANHKTHTQQGGSVFAKMILQPKRQSSGSCGDAVLQLNRADSIWNMLRRGTHFWSSDEEIYPLYLICACSLTFCHVRVFFSLMRSM